MRYLKLLGIFYKYSLVSELEYRAKFLANVFMSVFWLGWAGLMKKGTTQPFSEL